MNADELRQIVQKGEFSDCKNLFCRSELVIRT